MLKLFLRLMAFMACVYIIGLIGAVIGAAFELIFQYWWVLALGMILAVTLYFYRKHKIRKKKEKQAQELHAMLEKQRLEAEAKANEFSRYQHSEDSLSSIYDPPSVSVSGSGWLTYGGVEAELLNADLMDGHEFEYWCAALLRENGFVNVEVTQASGDDGVDILAEKDSIRYAIQCKRYNTYLGNKPIQEVHTGKSVYNCHVGAVMTNQYFTEGGQRAAQATGTLLWDRDWLREKIAGTQPTETPRYVDPPLSLEELEGDEMLPAAVDVILETGVVSVSILQRRLQLGYARAARIIDEMEKKGLIGPFQGSKPRVILITKEQWDQQRFVPQ